LPAISQKVARNLFLNSHKLLFVTKVAPKKTKKQKQKQKQKFGCPLSLFGLMQEYNKSNIPKHFCAILRRNQRC